MTRRAIICAVTTLCIVMGLGAMAALASAGHKRHHHRFGVIGPAPTSLRHSGMSREQPRKRPKRGTSQSATTTSQTSTTTQASIASSTSTTVTASSAATATTTTNSAGAGSSPAAASNNDPDNDPPDNDPDPPGKPGKAPKAPKPARASTSATPGPPGCQDHCGTGEDNSQCGDHCYGTADANCHDHCYGSGDTNCHDHCYGGNASQCSASCQSSDNGGGTASPSSSASPTPSSSPPSSSSSPPSTTSSSPSSSASSTLPPAAPPSTSPSTNPIASTGPGIRISRPAVGPVTPPAVGLVPPGASAFAAGTQGQGTAQGNRGLASSLARGTTAIGAGGGQDRRAVAGAHVRRSASISEPADAANTSDSAPATVIEHFITSIPASIWIVLGALLLLAASAAVAAWRSSVHARRQTAVAAAVSAAALTDSLTGILNRRGFVEAFERELDRARRYDRPLALAFVDVRGLKAVNDSHGHLAGDRLLQDVAAMLGESARAHDIVGRIGGDELGVLLPEQSSDGVARVVQRVKSQVNTRRHTLGFATPWDLTVGVALFPEDGEDVEELLEVADRRLYQQRGIELR